MSTAETAAQFKITWVDRNAEPQCKPNPAYPDGKDVVGHFPGENFCKAELVHPAKRIGFYLVQCAKCGTLIAVTTAGRPDDPRSVTIACKRGRVAS